MSRERDAVLCEMGLGPIWKLREQTAETVPAAATPAVVRVSVSEADTPPPPAAMAEGAPPDHDVPLDAYAFDSRPDDDDEDATPTVDDRAARIAAMDWVELKQSVAECRACELCKQRKQAVLGVGDVNADWLVVGEGPGADEDERGEPFVGAAGKLLDAMLDAIGLKRGKDVYIANSVKCRPPGNRTPEAAEINACAPYLQRQIALLQPRLVIALGRPAAQTLLGREVKIGEARGKLHAHRDIPLIVTYHPAYLLRTLPDKAKAWEDLVFARRTMQKLKNS